MFASVGQALLDTEVASLLVGEQNIKASLANAQATARSANDPLIVSLTKQLQKRRVELTANRNAGPRSEHFRSVGHALIALLAGLLGGTVAVWFYARRERAEAASQNVSR